MAAEDRDVLFRIGFTEHPGANQVLGNLADEVTRIQKLAEEGGGKLGAGVSKAISEVGAEASAVAEATSLAGDSSEGMAVKLSKARSEALGMADAMGAVSSQAEKVDSVGIEAINRHLSDAASATRAVAEEGVFMASSWRSVSEEVHLANAHLTRAAESGAEAADSVTLVGDNVDVLKTASDEAAGFADNMSKVEENSRKAGNETKEAASEITKMSIALSEADQKRNSAGFGGLGRPGSMPSGPSGGGPPDPPDFDPFAAALEDLVERSEVHYERLDFLRQRDGESVSEHQQRVADTFLREVDDVKVYAKNIDGMADGIRGILDGLDGIGSEDVMNSPEIAKTVEESVKVLEQFVKDNEALDARLAKAEEARVAAAVKAAEEVAAAKARETAEIAQASKEVISQYSQIGNEIDRANQQVDSGTRAALASVTTLGQGLGKVARGLTILNVLDEEDSAAILETVGTVQALIDTVGGLTHTVTGAIRGWDGLTKMLTGSKTAKEKEREETELAMKSSKLLQEALKREVLTARQAAKAHEALAKARAGESSKRAAKTAERNAAGFGGLGRPGSHASSPSEDDDGGGAGDNLGTVGDLIGGEAGEAISGLGEQVDSITEGLDGLKELSPRLETSMTKLGKTISNGLTKTMTTFKSGLGKMVTKGGNVFSKLMSSKLGKVVGKAGKSLGKYALSAGAAFKTFAGGTAAAAAGLASAFVAAAAGVAFAATSIWYAFDDSANAVGGYNDVIATAEVSTLNWVGKATGAFDLVGDSAYELAEAAAWQSWNMGVAAAAAESLAMSLDKVTQNAESEIRRNAQKADADVFDQNKGMLKTTEEKISAVDSRISQLTQEKDKRVSERGEIEELEGKSSEAKRKAAVLERKQREDGKLSEDEAAALVGWLEVEAKAEADLAEMKSNYHQEESALDEELLRRQKEKLQLTKQQQSELVAQTKKEVSALEQVIRFRQKEIDKITERGEADKKSYAESRKAAIESAEDRFAAMSKSEQRRAVDLVKDLKSGKIKAEDLRDRDADLLGNVGGDFAKEQLRKRNNANARANGFNEELFGTTEKQDKDFAEREKERVASLMEAEKARQQAIEDMAKKTGKTVEQVESDIREAENRQKETGARVDIIDQREIEVKIESQFEEKIDSINELIVSAIRANQESEAERIREVAEETIRRLQTEDKNKQKQAKQTSK